MSAIADWRPTATLAALELRARALAVARRFFAARRVLEVETPQIVAVPVADPNVRNVACQLGVPHPRRLWLHTSAEYHMKRLLAAGAPDIYQLCKVFRDGESGRRHLPEFTMIEWYRRGLPLAGMAAETCALVAELAACAGRALAAPTTVHYADLLRETAGVDALGDGVPRLRDRARALLGERVPAQLAAALGDDRDAWLDLLVSEQAQPALKGRGLAVVDRYPASQAALARLAPDDPRVAERFEVFLDGVELANGYRELTDATEQRERFEAEAARRRAAGEPVPALDARLLAALESGLPECSGVALGFDRVLMAALGATDILDVVSFPVPDDA